MLPGLQVLSTGLQWLKYSQVTENTDKVGLKEPVDRLRLDQFKQGSQGEDAPQDEEYEGQCGTTYCSICVLPSECKSDRLSIDVQLAELGTEILVPVFADCLSLQPLGDV